MSSWECAYASVYKHIYIYMWWLEINDPKQGGKACPLLQTMRAQGVCGRGGCLEREPWRGSGRSLRPFLVWFCWLEALSFMSEFCWKCTLHYFTLRLQPEGSRWPKSFVQLGLRAQKP